MPALIFDYDGLMVNSELMLAECIVDTVAAFGGTATIQDFGHLFGSTEMDHEWDRLIPTWCDAPVSRVEFDEHVRVAYGATGDTLPLLPGVRSLIDSARDAGWQVGLGTGQSLTRLEARLRYNDVYECFDAIVTAGEVERGKPAPDVFLEVAARLQVAPGDCVVLEDSPHGCAAALAAGMHVLVCPSLVTAHCSFPDHVRRVSALTELTIESLRR